MRQSLNKNTPCDLPYAPAEELKYHYSMLLVY